MILLACQSCHAQYDVTGVDRAQFKCQCGETIENRPLEAMEVEVHRCSACGAQVKAAAESCAYCGSSVVQDRHKLSLICPECCARNADDARFCAGCGVTFSPREVTDEGFEVPCPVCTCLMEVRSAGHIAINECPQCNGIWAREDRFELLVKRAIEAKRDGAMEQAVDFQPRVKGANPATQSVEYRRCPECDAFMQRRNYRKSSGVIIDVCHKHGTFLDADELEQIAGYILSGGRPKADRFLAEEKASADAEFKRARLENLQMNGGRRTHMPSDHHRIGSKKGEFDVGGSLVRLLTSIFDD